MTNELYYGDNLAVLRKSVKSETVDLCYIDPPFNSKRNYFQIYNNQGSEDRAQAQAFVDTWNWGDEAVEGIDYILSIERLHGGEVAELFAPHNVRLDLPMARADAVKSAAAAGDADKQAVLL